VTSHLSPHFTLDELCASALTVAVLAAVLIRGESVLGFVRVWRRKP
jgi:hypothetical protein